MATITTVAAGNWSDGSNFDLGRSPQAGDTVELHHAITVDTTDATADLIRANGAGRLTVNTGKRIFANAEAVSNTSNLVTLTGEWHGNITATSGPGASIATNGVLVGNVTAGTHDAATMSGGLIVGIATGSATTYNEHGVRMLGGRFIGQAIGGASGYGVFGHSARYVYLTKCVGNGRRGFDGRGVIYIAETQQNGAESAAYLNTASYELGVAADPGQITMNGVNNVAITGLALAAAGVAPPATQRTLLNGLTL